MSKPRLNNPRLRAWSLLILQEKPTIKYIKGPQLVSADALSRLDPFEDEPEHQLGLALDETRAGGHKINAIHLSPKSLQAQQQADTSLSDLRAQSQAALSY